MRVAGMGVGFGWVRGEGGGGCLLLSLVALFDVKKSRQSGSNLNVGKETLGLFTSGKYNCLSCL